MSTYQGFTDGKTVSAASTVFLVSLAFSGSALVLSFFTTNNDKSTEDFVAGNIHGSRKEKEGAGKEHE